FRVSVTQIGVPLEEHQSWVRRNHQRGFVPQSFQALPGPKGEVLCNSVWWLTLDLEWTLIDALTILDEGALKRKDTAGPCLSDLCLTPRPRPVPARARFTGQQRRGEARRRDQPGDRAARLERAEALAQPGQDKEAGAALAEVLPRLEYRQ